MPLPDCTTINHTLISVSHFLYTALNFLTVDLIYPCSLAMFGILGMLLQASASGKGVVQQLGETLTWPESRAVMEGMGTLGDYFPPGI